MPMEGLSNSGCRPAQKKFITVPRKHFGNKLSIAAKPFAVGPHKTHTYYILNLILVNDLQPFGPGSVAAKARQLH